MKEDLRLLLTEIAGWPFTYGLSAALVRWLLGDHKGGVRLFFLYICCSLFVAWGASLGLEDEGLTDGRKGLYILIMAFVAKDILTGLAGLALQFGAKPLETLARLRDAYRGGASQ